MRWNYLSVTEPGFVPCTVCGREFPDPSIMNGDILYYPNFRGDSDAWQADWIRRIWQVDPYADFAVCEDCMQGHCGAVYGLNATTWLDNKIEQYLQQRVKETEEVP